MICVYGWATAAADEDPREAAAAHIAETAPAGAAPVWVERPGGRVCVPANGQGPGRSAAGDGRAAGPVEGGSAEAYEPPAVTEVGPVGELTEGADSYGFSDDGAGSDSFHR